MNHFETCTAARVFCGILLETHFAQRTVFFVCARAYSNTQNAFSIKVDTVSILEKVSA